MELLIREGRSVRVFRSDQIYVVKGGVLTRHNWHPNDGDIVDIEISAGTQFMAGSQRYLATRDGIWLEV